MNSGDDATVPAFENIFRVKYVGDKFSLWGLGIMRLTAGTLSRFSGPTRRQVVTGDLVYLQVIYILNFFFFLSYYIPHVPRRRQFFNPSNSGH